VDSALTAVSANRKHRRILRVNDVLNGATKMEMRIRAMPMVADTIANDGTTMESVVANKEAFGYVSVSSLQTKTNKTDVISNSKNRFRLVCPGASDLLVEVRACYSPPNCFVAFLYNRPFHTAEREDAAQAAQRRDVL
jgi:hypothetical protein